MRNDSWWTLAATLVRLYRATLRIYPAGFRRAFGREMIDAFRDSSAEVRRRGRAQLLSHGLHAISESVFQGLMERLSLRRRTVRKRRSAAVQPEGRNHSAMSCAGGALLEDVRFALRTFRRRPLFTSIVVLTVGLGIGGTTAIFSVVEGMLLRPLPYSRPSGLVTVFETFPEWRTITSLSEGWNRVTLDYPSYERWALNQSFFEEVAAFGSTSMTLTGFGDPELIRVGTATSSLLPVLGVSPLLGRWFHPSEDGSGASRVAIVSHGCWQDRFGADVGVLERTITLNGQAFQVVGILPRSFYLRRLGYGADPEDPGTPLVWIPIGVENNSLRAGNHLYEGIARLKPGITVGQAATQTENLIRGERDPAELGARLLSAEERRELEIGSYRAPLLLLMGASLILLLIACGNVAMLSLAEVSGRRIEMLTRAALGARPMRLVRQLLTESVLLGLFGSAVGILVAVASLYLLAHVAPPIRWLQEVRVNSLVLLFASAVGILTGLLFGLAPTVNLPRREGQALMRRGAADGGRIGQAFFQRAVVSLEIALTVVLLVCGGLLARSLVSLFSVDAGFQHQHLAEVRVQLLRNRFPDAETRNSVLLDIIEAIETVPGVSRASGTSGLPFSGSGWMSDIEVEGHEADSDPLVSYRLVLPGFFEVMQIPWVHGRALSDADHWAEPGQSVVVSESMAQRFWPHDNPVGRRVRFDDRWFAVVGVVGDVRHESLTSEYTPTIYVPVRTPTVSLVVRTEVEPQPLFPQIREAVRSVDPGAPIFRMSTVKSLMSETATHERFRTVLLMTFALFAVLLGAAGVFGVTARSVSRRTKEMGIRIALGAQGQGLTRVVVWRGLSSGVIGMALGFPVALATTALLSPFLFGVERWDPLTYGAVASLMAVVCCLASYVPARRIAALDPVDVLRSN